MTSYTQLWLQYRVSRTPKIYRYFGWNAFLPKLFLYRIKTDFWPHKSLKTGKTIIMMMVFLTNSLVDLKAKFTGFYSVLIAVLSIIKVLYVLYTSCWPDKCEHLIGSVQLTWKELANCHRVRPSSRRRWTWSTTRWSAQSLCGCTTYPGTTSSSATYI